MANKTREFKQYMTAPEDRAMQCIVNLSLSLIRPYESSVYPIPTWRLQLLNCLSCLPCPLSCFVVLAYGKQLAATIESDTQHLITMEEEIKSHSEVTIDLIKDVVTRYQDKFSLPIWQKLEPIMLAKRYGGQFDYKAKVIDEGERANLPENQEGGSRVDISLADGFELIDLELSTTSV